MKALAGWFMILFLAYSLTGCAPSWLKGPPMTQEEIRQRYGPPHFTWMLGSGHTVWEYRFDMGIHGYPGEADCMEYSFTFDQDQTLRSQSRRRC